MKTEAEMGVTPPQAQGCLQLPEAGRHKALSLSRSLRRACGLADTLVSDFWLAVLRPNKCLLLQDTQFVIVHYSSPRKLRQQTVGVGLGPGPQGTRQKPVSRTERNLVRKLRSSEEGPGVQ